MERDGEELEGVRARVGARDPELLTMVDDVDRTLIRAMLALGPWERVRAGVRMAQTLEELARCRRPNSTR